MIEFEEYEKNFRKSGNFDSDVNFEDKFAIIKETLNLDQHKMFMRDGFEELQDIYNNLTELEVADLIDYLEIEKLYGRSCKKR